MGRRGANSTGHLTSQQGEFFHSSIICGFIILTIEMSVLLYLYQYIHQILQFEVVKKVGIAVGCLLVHIYLSVPNPVSLAAGRLSFHTPVTSLEIKTLMYMF